MADVRRDLKNMKEVDRSCQKEVDKILHTFSLEQSNKNWGEVKASLNNEQYLY